MAHPRNFKYNRFNLVSSGHRYQSFVSNSAMLLVKCHCTEPDIPPLDGIIYLVQDNRLVCLPVSCAIRKHRVRKNSEKFRIRKFIPPFFMQCELGYAVHYCNLLGGKYIPPISFLVTARDCIVIWTKCISEQNCNREIQ